MLRRAIDKWLAAGVLEEGCVVYPESGSPQGGVISPILSNIYLHEVLDRWFADIAKFCLRGSAFLVRYADDAVIVFSDEVDAKRVMDALPERFGKYALSLHPEKTRLVRFRRPGLFSRGRKNRPDSFDFLGFTHHWAKSWRGIWVVKRRTARSRLARALKAVGAWLRQNRHLSLDEQRKVLAQKLQGHYSYYGITNNGRALGIFQYHVLRLWWKWLRRRSQRHRLNWEQFSRLLKRYPLPRPRVVHSAYRSVANP